MVDCKYVCLCTCECIGCGTVRAYLLVSACVNAWPDECALQRVQGNYWEGELDAPATAL